MARPTARRILTHYEQSDRRRFRRERGLKAKSIDGGAALKATLTLAAMSGLFDAC